MSFSNPRELAQTRRDDMSNRTWHRQVPPSVCCGEKKAGGPIGTNSFGFCCLVVCVKRETCKTETVLDFLGRVRCERCGFWILLLLDFRMVAELVTFVL